MNNSFDKEIIEVFLDDIIPNRFQPRLNFDEKSLLELAESIKQHGIIQPLVLRRLGDKFEIIAGERRYKASQMAGLSKVPAIIADLDDNSSAEVAIVENLHRKNMSSLEEARSFKKLLERGITQDQLGIRLGKSQSYIANKLRLLNLSEVVQNALIQEQISERHARSLLSVKDLNAQQEILNEIITRKLTVKETDDLIKERFGEESEEESSVEELVPSIDAEENKNMDIMEFNLENIKEEIIKPVEETEQLKIIESKPTLQEDVISNQVDNQLSPQNFVGIQDVKNGVVSQQYDQIDNAKPEINAPKPFVIVEEINKESMIPEPHKNVELNPQVNLINKLSDPRETTRKLSLEETIGSNPSPYVTPKIDIKDNYLKPNNPFNVEEIKNNAQPVNVESQKSFDINQLLISDSKKQQTENRTQEPLVKEQELQQNKFIMNVNEQQPMKQENRDINSSKNMIKNIVETIKNSGVNIDYEEFDFERLYQIIIKLEK